MTIHIFNLQHKDSDVKELREGLVKCYEWLSKGACSSHEDFSTPITYNIQYWNTDVLDIPKEDYDFGDFSGRVLCMGGFVDQVTSLHKPFRYERFYRQRDYRTWGLLDKIFYPFRHFETKDYSVENSSRVLGHFLSTNQINWDL